MGNVLYFCSSWLKRGKGYRCFLKNDSLFLHIYIRRVLSTFNKIIIQLRFKTKNSSSLNIFKCDRLVYINK